MPVGFCARSASSFRAIFVWSILSISYALLPLSSFPETDYLRPFSLFCLRFPPEIIEMPVGFLVETDDKNPLWALTGCTGFLYVCVYICVDMCTYNFESKPTIQRGVESWDALSS